MKRLLLAAAATFISPVHTGGCDEETIGSIVRGGSVVILDAGGVYKVEPDYSTEARQAKYQGSVVLTVDVDINGIVTHIHVQRSLGLGLDEKAIEAVKRWRFKPGTKNGQPTAMQTQVNVDFRRL